MNKILFKPKRETRAFDTFRWNTLVATTMKFHKLLQTKMHPGIFNCNNYIDRSNHKIAKLVMETGNKPRFAIFYSTHRSLQQQSPTFCFAGKKQCKLPDFIAMHKLQQQPSWLIIYHGKERSMSICHVLLQCINCLRHEVS